MPISRILRYIRIDFPALHESDEELIEQIVMDAIEHGLAIHFDGRGKS